MEVHRIRSHVARIVEDVSREMFGLDTEIRLCLAALYTGGHVLLEGNPGLGKTELVKSLGRVLGLQAKRIQFTPDLMPSDITGTEVLVPGSGARFQKGPIFASLVLADEINRATPKTQSATLEAMAEKKVTVLGNTYPLPFPFVVLGTQNPIDHEGTYNLPAAQADRFMFKIRMPVPGAKTAEAIVDKRSSNWTDQEGSGSSLTVATEPDPVADISRTVRAVQPLPDVKMHITNIYLSTNCKFDELRNTAGTLAEIRVAAGRFQYGISPRAAGDIMLGAKAWVCLSDGEVDHASAFHLKAVVVNALRHRLRLSFSDDLDRDQASDLGSDPEDQLEAAVRELCVLTAPKGSAYGAYWQYWKAWTA